MTKFLKIALVLTFIFSPTIPARATGEGLSNVSETSLATVSGSNVQNTNLTDLGSGKVMASWLEEMEGSTWLKVRTMMANGSLSATKTVNGETAAFNANGDTPPVITSNKSGKTFASWIEQSVVDNKVVQRVMGATTTDGLTWSDPFEVIAATTFDQYSGGCERGDDRLSCGFTRLANAVDGQGNLAVAVAKRSSDEKTRLFATVKVKNTNWTRLHRFGTVQEIRDVAIVGLTSGFITNHMNYQSAATCGVYASVFSVSSKTWGDPLTGTFRAVNTVIHSKWVQLDNETLVLAMASEELSGGLFYRSFNLKTGMWKGLSKEILPAKESVVYQSVMATKVGNGIAIGYITYDRIKNKSIANIATQTSPTADWTNSAIEASGDQLNPMFIASTANGTPVFAYQGSVTKGRISKGSATAKNLRIFKNATWAGNGLLVSADTVFTITANGDGGEYEIGIVKGKLN